MQQATSIEVAEGGYDLPVEDVLTGRGLCCGKSGSGKTNTVSVIVEQLLEAGLPLMIIDTEGEYHPLTEAYDVLHVGPDETSYDRKITEESIRDIVDVALHENVPVIMDVSEFDQEETVNTFVEMTIRDLFEVEKNVKKPFLLVVEEVHEYVPEQGGFDALAEMIIRVAKRGRKRGLGICGVSQRPAAVSKDFITQCDWLVWHRLTWKNDVDVVKRILGSEYADTIPDLDTGEAFVMADWDEEVHRVKFFRKQTRDAGATPGLEALDGTDTHSINEDTRDNEEPGTTAGRVEELRRQLDQKDQRIRELEDQIERMEAQMTSLVDPAHVEGAQDDADEEHEPEPLVIELSSFLVYLISMATLYTRRGLTALSRKSITLIERFQEVYRKQRYEPYSAVRRVFLIVGTCVVVGALLFGVAWIGLRVVQLLA